MPLVPKTTGRFNKDVKLMKRRGKGLHKLRGIMEKLIEQQPLAPKNRDHPLVGNYVDRRECHIESDWLLIYKLEEDWILFERTGTHADLFE